MPHPVVSQDLEHFSLKFLPIRDTSQTQCYASQACHTYVRVVTLRLYYKDCKSEGEIGSKRSNKLTIAVDWIIKSQPCA